MRDRLFHFVYREPLQTMAIVGIVLTLLYLSGILQLISLTAGHTFSGIFGFIWNHALPWPDCGHPTGRRGLDICVGMGVIYLPFTIILTLGIMFAGIVGVLLITVLLVSKATGRY